MKGFTIFELLIVFAIVGILAAIFFPMYAEYKATGTIPTVSQYGVRQTCVNGYVYTVDRNGSAMQQINEQGTAIRCR